MVEEKVPTEKTNAQKWLDSQAPDTHTAFDRQIRTQNWN
jgi:hypothetical protein